MISGMRSRLRSQEPNSRIAIRQMLGPALALGPTALWYVLFFLVPLALMVRYSLAFTSKRAAGVCLDAGKLCPDRQRSDLPGLVVAEPAPGGAGDGITLLSDIPPPGRWRAPLIATRLNCWRC